MDKITQNVATLQRNYIDKQLLPGNIIPHQWFHRIVDSNNNPDLVAINILADLIGWIRYFDSNNHKEIYNNNPIFDGKELAVSYDYLQNKFNISRERIRKSLVRLEELNIITRNVRNIKLNDGSRCNQLFIAIDSNFYNSCFRNPELDIRATPSKIRSPQIQGDHIIGNNNINKNRSIKSNFCDGLEEKKNTISKITSHIFEEAKKLKDFYPLNQEQCETLQRESGREFNLHAMNEILKNISNKLGNRYFKSSKSFMSYMAKIFTNELREAEQINNNDFYIKENLSTADKQHQERGMLLEEIERSRDMSLDSQLKRKLVNRLSESKAYDLITSYKSCRRVEDRAMLQLSRAVEITPMDKDIILAQIKSVFEQSREDLFNPILDLKIEVMNQRRQHYEVSSVCFQSGNKAPQHTNNIWDRVRANIRKEHGDGVDKAWFSKLTPKIDEERKRVELRAESSLVKNWVKTQYGQLLELNFKQNEYKYIII